MKKIFKTLVLALSLGILITTVKIYMQESEKVSALQDHMSFLATKENVEYISLEEEERLAKEEEERKKAEEKAAKEEAERLAKEEEEARKAEEARKKEEELQRKKEEEEARLRAEKTIRMDVAIINQLPEYKNGCEATSLTMLLNFAGISVDKSTVISKVKKDETPISYDGSGNIKEWGNPEVGFVGDITGKKPGYSIDPIALAPTIEEYLPGKSLNLTGSDFSKLEQILLSGRPIVVWVNTEFEEPSVSYTWTSNGVTVSAHKRQHAVLLTGVDETHFYYNDPLTGEKDAKIDKNTFKTVWVGTGSKALSYYK